MLAAETSDVIFLERGLAMEKPKKHVFICTSSRMTGQQKGFCHTKGAVDLVNAFMEAIEEADLEGIFVSNTGCFGLCEEGPVVVVYPDNVWYGKVSEDDVTEIVEEHLAEGRIVERLAL